MLRWHCIMKTCWSQLVSFSEKLSLVKIFLMPQQKRLGTGHRKIFGVFQAYCKMGYLHSLSPILTQSFFYLPPPSTLSLYIQSCSGLKHCNVWCSYVLKCFNFFFWAISHLCMFMQTHLTVFETLAQNISLIAKPFKEFIIVKYFTW